MGLRLHILFSVVTHATLFTLAFAMNGRDAGSRAPAGHITVMLVDAPEGRAVAASPGKGGLSERRIITRPGTSAFEAPARGSSGHKETAGRAAAPADSLSEAAVRGENKGSNDGTGMHGADAPKGESWDGVSPAAGAPSGVFLARPGASGGEDGTATQGKPGPGGGSGQDPFGAIRAAIERSKSYPLLAKKRGIEGTVVAEFTINARGIPENIRVLRSSGHAVLDSAAKETIQRAAPYPPVDGLIEVPIAFRLKKGGE